MYTSNYAKLKKIIQAGLRPVGISIGLPKSYTGDREVRLAPTWAMLKMERSDYERHFHKILTRLNAEELYATLGNDAVLLCFCKHNKDWCHRRIVAEWFENQLGIIVPEFGFDRSETLPYAQSGLEPEKQNKPDLENVQGGLFE